MLLFVAPARAEYVPDAEFLAKMEEMLAVAGETVVQPPFNGAPVFSLKTVQAGKGYREGDAAYFVIESTGDSFMLLEEWRLQEDGNFRVTFTQLWPFRAVRWVINFTPEGRVLDKGGIYEELLWDLSGRNPEKAQLPPPLDLIKKSERAQELLMKDGRPLTAEGLSVTAEGLQI
jgi:hypothetical protein